MTRLRVFLSRALDIVLRRRREERLSEEIQAHLDLLAAEHMTRGLGADEARLAARRAFGGVEQVREEYRDQRGLPRLDTLLQDLRLAVRLLWRDPGFAAAAVAVLGLGIGVNNMLFTIVNAHTIRGLPIREPARVVYLTTRDDRTPNLGVSFLDFTDWQAGARSFEALAAYNNEPVVVSGDGRAPDTFSGTFVSANAFALVGTRPMLGRDFTSSDDAPGAAAVIVLGTALWESRYGRDPGVLGRSIVANGAPAVIVGVMPDRSGFPSTAQIWLPLSQFPGLREQPRNARTLHVIGRVRDGIDVSQAGAEIEAIAAHLASAHAATNKQTRARMVPINEQYLGALTDPAWIAFMAVGMIVVLISCANAANLMLARSISRSREIAIRRALGASRRRVVRQLCVEGMTLAALAGTVGLGLAVVGVRLFGAGIPAGELPYWIEYSSDARVLAALVAVSGATVLLFALVPAIHGSKPDLNIVLKEGGRASAGFRGRRWTTAFLAAEFGLTVILLAHFVANFRATTPALPSDVALQTTQILTAEIALPPAVYDTPERRAAFYAALGERLDAVTSIQAGSVASALPLLGGEPRRLEIMDRPLLDKEQQQTAWTVAVGTAILRDARPLTRARPGLHRRRRRAGPAVRHRQRTLRRALFSRSRPDRATDCRQRGRYYRAAGLVDHHRRRAFRATTPDRRRRRDRVSAAALDAGGERSPDRAQRDADGRTGRAVASRDGRPRSHPASQSDADDGASDPRRGSGSAAPRGTSRAS